MLVGKVGGNDQRGDEIDRLAIARTEIDGFGEMHEGGAGVVDRIAAPVRNRNAVAQARAAQPLPGRERLTQDGDIIDSGEQARQLLDQVDLVANNEAGVHPPCGE